MDPQRRQDQFKQQELDLSGNNWVIKDTAYDHMTKLNFKKTIQQMGAFNLLRDGSGLFSDGSKTSSFKTGRSELLILMIYR